MRGSTSSALRAPRAADTLETVESCSFTSTPSLSALTFVSLLRTSFQLDKVPTSLLIPACVDLASKRTSPLTGEPVMVLAAGGIYDGRGLASALMSGAAGVWVGTRFVSSTEASAPEYHKKLIVGAGYDVRSFLLPFLPFPPPPLPFPFVLSHLAHL